jgi:hypothetical protein
MMNSQAMKITAPLPSNTISLSKSGFIKSPRRILIASAYRSAFPLRSFWEKTALLIRIDAVLVASEQDIHAD